MPRLMLRIAALSALAVVIVATLGPISLRPHVTGGSADLERFLAYLVLTVLFVWAFPKRIFAVASLILLVALGLELFQGLVPGRHGEPLDAVIKVLGGAVGLQLGMLTRNTVALLIEP